MLDDTVRSIVNRLPRVSNLDHFSEDPGSCLRILLRICALTMAAWRSSGQVARGEGESDIFLIRRYEYTRARGIWYEGGRFACHSRTSVTCEWGNLAVPTSPPEARSKKSSTPGARRLVRTHAKPNKRIKTSRGKRDSNPAKPRGR